MTRTMRRALAAAAVLAGGAVAGPGVAAQTMDDAIHTFVLLEQAEVLPGSPEMPFAYSGKAWIGTDYNRLWLKVEGSHLMDGPASGAGGLEIQGLYSRLIAPFWEIQAGLRYDAGYGAGEDGPSRAFLALGLEGLAPYWFEVEPFLFLSQDGDLSARLESSYELLFTQRLIAQPELEVNASFGDVPELGLAAGFTDLELGLRFRYEFRREFAPYVGVTWERLLGGTSSLVRDAGGEVSETWFVAGLRVWY